MNILIIRISAIGDVLHTIPAARLLKQAFPHAKIHWVVQQKAAAILQNQSFLDSMILLPDKPLAFKHWKATYQVINQLAKTNWDAIIDFQGILKSFVLIAALRGKKFGFAYHHARSKLISLTTHYHINPAPATNVVLKNLALASGVILKLNKNYNSSPTLTQLQKNYPLSIPIAFQKKVINWMEEHKIFNPIALSPNTTWNSKHWAVESWQQLILLLSKHQPYPIVLLGAHMGGQAAQLATLSTPNFFVAPAFDLLTTSYFLKQAQLLVAPDTGILHLADAVGTPMLGLFGPTSPKIHGPIISGTHLKNTLKITCPHQYEKKHGTIDCMDQLKPEIIAKLIIQKSKLFYPQQTSTISSFSLAVI